ncbi:MAG: prenyltransferase [Desulfitobacterium hafniense]|nr:prenyltransferase [Desulfitobacterium hafniense]
MRENRLLISSHLESAKKYVFQGMEQILNNQQDESHSISVSPGATALACLALLALGKGYENQLLKGINWLGENRFNNAWGKYPGDSADEEVTHLARAVIQGSTGGWLAKIALVTQARQFSDMILSLGQRVVTGLVGPTPEEIRLPRILEDKVLAKLPPYGRPVVVAAALLAAGENQSGIKQGLEYLKNTQMHNGSWAEDIVATSLGILAFLKYRGNMDRARKAGNWLIKRQYQSGGWPAFDQLKNWAAGWGIVVLKETGPKSYESDLITRVQRWLVQAKNTDGSYGTTPPYTHPDLDDTAVALLALKQHEGNKDTLELLKRLQNSEGSWGTFPDFQGKPPELICNSPVYITSVDVTIHVLEALSKSESCIQDQVFMKGLNWLLSEQTSNGDFPSVWFEGNVYSTAQALEIMSKLRFNWQQFSISNRASVARKKSVNFLLNAQKEDGGWGSVIETSFALSVLCCYQNKSIESACQRALVNLLSRQKSTGSFENCYKGIYAKGWNYEEPISTTLIAIRAIYRSLNRFRN